MASITYIPLLRRVRNEARRLAGAEDGKPEDTLLYRRGDRIVIEQRLRDDTSFFLCPEVKMAAELQAAFSSDAHADMFIHLNARAFKWTPLDSALAQSQGWDIFCTGGPDELDIQRLDECSLLRDDTLALLGVVRQAPFSFHAAKALWLYEPEAERMRKDLVVGQSVVRYETDPKNGEAEFHTIRSVEKTGCILADVAGVVPFNQIFP